MGVIHSLRSENKFRFCQKMITIQLDERQAAIYRQISDHWDYLRHIVGAKPWEIKGGQVVLDNNADGVLINIGRLYPNKIEQLWRRTEIKKAKIEALDTILGG